MLRKLHRDAGSAFKVQHEWQAAVVLVEGCQASSFPFLGFSVSPICPSEDLEHLTEERFEQVPQPSEFDLHAECLHPCIGAASSPTAPHRWVGPQVRAGTGLFTGGVGPSHERLEDSAKRRGKAKEATVRLLALGQLQTGFCLLPLSGLTDMPFPAWNPQSPTVEKHSGARRDRRLSRSPGLPLDGYCEHGAPFSAPS